MTVIRLPVSGRTVAVRPPSGAEDLLLTETPALGAGLAVALVGRLASPLDGRDADWAQLPHTDLDTLVVAVRQAVLGDLVRAAARCPSAECGQELSVTFSLTEFLRFHRPRRPRDVLPDDEPGWWRAGAVRFRLPDGTDLMLAEAAADPAGTLRQRCMSPTLPPAPQRHRLERRMQALAPLLVTTVEGRCPACGLDAGLRFDARDYCLAELRDEARGVYDDVHLLASAYRWTQDDILGLPHTRRLRYAERVRATTGGAGRWPE